ncbi:hypothetical protein K443DRAFT_123581 [Laccaria amethystina LaAM-08-1]|uniref:Uncharacterized protein n=1 Tax=Laccaria amethystina LaAM-08-1 TaxID=1095629 RepID=A0A0C9X097_9AGAR|nr:hypothetical protein K443DRAFT_123581 [Laccaria amethystina LaAM-08-1]
MAIFRGCGSDWYHEGELPLYGFAKERSDGGAGGDARLLSAINVMSGPVGVSQIFWTFEEYRITSMPHHFLRNEHGNPHVEGHRRAHHPHLRGEAHPHAQHWHHVQVRGRLHQLREHLHQLRGHFHQLPVHDALSRARGQPRLVGPISLILAVGICVLTAGTTEIGYHGGRFYIKKITDSGKDSLKLNLSWTHGNDWRSQFDIMIQRSTYPREYD